MNEAQRTRVSIRGQGATRIIVLVNFLTLGVCIIPVTRPIAESVFKALDPYPVLPWFLDVWIIGSTLFATGLFVRDLARNLKGNLPLERTARDVTLDAVFLGVWWMTLLAICAYAFVLGMGG
jgi:hypothetical protein